MCDGAKDGLSVVGGLVVGTSVGAAVGTAVGGSVGRCGEAVGWLVGAVDGADVGGVLSEAVGRDVGAAVSAVPARRGADVLTETGASVGLSASLLGAPGVSESRTLAPPAAPPGYGPNAAPL